MSWQSSIAHSSVGETLGALFVGATVSAVLSGVTIPQAVMYYRRYADDWWVYRYSVGILWALEILHVALCTYTLYLFLIHFFGDLVGALEYNVWYWQLSVNDFLIVLYAIRLWQVGRHFHKALICFVSLAVVASLGTAICAVVVYDAHITPNLTSASTLPMFYYLHKSRAVIHVPSTATVLLRLMRLVLMSGLATSGCSLLTLISYIVWPQSLAFLGIHFFLSKLYINSLLAMLNSRSKHHSTSQYETDSAPTLVQIPSHSSEANVEETNISISLQDIGSFANQVDPLKECPDCRV
ncbi:hypothetical protein ARMGADRAFT_816244 [Armillaria gallica]|uniref:DUF6534 domain-containing protein n=1 Tax=Armillaria gallica TaxID=47427 RepID=A0A2H3CDH2_ARMGA|nr:hypothetical protein ARMGADRAFT_816244 [Armillaria gallica]